MDAHLKYLADDLLEGRAPATRGGELAARYIAAQFEAIGLRPAGPDGSYYQPVTLIGMTPRPSFVWGAGTKTESLRYRDDFVAWAGRSDPHIAVDGDVVFVGYGVRAPEWNWDDYKAVDVRGKVLLMLVNDPGLQDTSVFKGRGLTYYGRWTYKLEEAARRGACRRCAHPYDPQCDLPVGGCPGLVVRGAVHPRRPCHAADRLRVLDHDRGGYARAQDRRLEPRFAHARRRATRLHSGRNTPARCRDGDEQDAPRAIRERGRQARGARLGAGRGRGAHHRPLRPQGNRAGAPAEIRSTTAQKTTHQA